MATFHITNINGDQITKSSYCPACAVSLGHKVSPILLPAAEMGCGYCGGEADPGIPNFATRFADKWLCRPCGQEYIRFVSTKLPGIGTPEFNYKQAGNILPILIELDEHMKKWVAERKK